MLKPYNACIAGAGSKNSTVSVEKLPATESLLRPQQIELRGTDLRRMNEDAGAAPLATSGKRGDFLVLDAAIPAERDRWLALWHSWPNRDVVAHRDFTWYFSVDPALAIEHPPRAGRHGTAPTRLALPDRWASSEHCRVEHVGTSDVVLDDVDVDVELFDPELAIVPVDEAPPAEVVSASSHATTVRAKKHTRATRFIAPTSHGSGASVSV